MAEEEITCPNKIFTSGLKFSALGLVLSSYMNATQTHKHGAMGVFTRTGWMIGWIGATGATYEAVKCLSQTVRGKDDHWNQALGSSAAGALATARTRNIQTIAMSSLIFGVVMFAYGKLGNSLVGLYMNETEEERVKRRLAFFVSDEERQQRKENEKLAKEYMRTFNPREAEEKAAAAAAAAESN